MPQFWTEDPSIGQALSGLAESFSGKNVVSMANTIEDIKQKRLLAQARADAAAKAESMWNARATPQAAPVTSAQDAWVNSSGTQGTENVPIMGGLKPLAPLGPAQAADTAATGQAQQQINQEFARVRAKNLADARLAYNVASSAGDVVGNMPKQEALTQLDLYGVPKTLEGQYKMQTQLTGQLPMLDVKGTTNNWTATDPATGVTTSGQTRDGRTDLNTGKLLPPGALKMGDVSADQSPFKDTGAQLQALNNLTAKVAIGNQQLTADEKQRAGIILAERFPNVQKVEKDDAGNLRVIGYNEKAVPPVYAPLIAHLNQGMVPAVPGAPSTPQQPPLAPQQQAPQAGGTRVDPLASVMPPGVTTGPNPPGQQAPAAPILPPGVTVSPPVVSGSGDPQFKEALNNPIYQRAVAAGTAYSAMTEAFKTNSPAADLQGIYMLAKIFDPQSAVREGELHMAASTGSIGDTIMGMYNKLAKGEAQLTPAMRADFEKQAYVAAMQHYGAAKDLIGSLQDRAGVQQLDPRLVTPALREPAAPVFSTISTEKRGTISQPTGPREVGPADREAIAWARSNPKDPRAVQILRQNGL